MNLVMAGEYKTASYLTLKGLTLAAVGLCAAFTAIAAPVGSAHAGAPDRFNVGQCGKSDVVMRTLGQDGHGFVADMNADLVDTKQQKFVKREHIVTATPNGAHWYLLKGNGAKGQSSELCIAMKGINLEINDNYDNTNTPTVTPLTYSKTDMSKHCDQMEKAQGSNLVCNGLQEIRDHAQQISGQILMLQGTVILQNGHTDTLFSLIADPVNDNDYRMLSSNKNSGATLITQSGTDASFSKRVMTEIQKRK